MRLLHKDPKNIKLYNSSTVTWEEIWNENHMIHFLDLKHTFLINLNHLIYISCILKRKNTVSTLNMLPNLCIAISKNIQISHINRNQQHIKSNLQLNETNLQNGP